MQAFRSIRDWVVPTDFLSLSKDCVEEINERVRNSNILNESQCRDLSSKLAETIENVTALVSNCGESSSPFLPALRNLYKISFKAKRLVSNCSNENWREASLIFQFQNDEAFQEILLEMGLCYNVICEQAKGMRGKRDPQIPDLRESSTFSPATKEKVRKDRELVQEILVRLASTIYSSSWEKCLAKYLLRKVGCPPQHGQVNELDISTSPILWVKETEPPGTWKHDGFLGGGSGASGVCSTLWLGIPCAKKEFHTEVDMAIFVREAGILYRLSHPNIVKFFCCSNGPEKGRCFIGMELMQMSLSDLIRDRAKKGRKPFPLSVALDIIVQIARGMCYLHDFGIAHRDLKPSNVVVNRLITPHLEDNFCVKLVDFGMSKTKVEVSKSNTISIPGVGTTRYRAPEVHPKAQNPKQGNRGHAKVVWSKADVYSFGVTCAEILSLETPFEDVELSKLYIELARGARPELPSHCPRELVFLIKQCWSGDPCSRPGFIDICTRLEVVRHDLSRDSTSVAHGGSQEVGIYRMGYKYIEEMLRKYEHERRKHSAEEPDNLHNFVGLDQECDVVLEERGDEGQGSRLQEIWDPEHDPHKSGSDMFTSGALFGNPLMRERRDPQEKEILPDMQATLRRPDMLIGSAHETPPLETPHGVGPIMRQYAQTLASTSGPDDTSLQIPCLVIEDPNKCQTTTIAVPYYGRKGDMLYYIHQGDSLLLWKDDEESSTFYMLKDWKYVSSKCDVEVLSSKGTPTTQSSWQLLCDGVDTPRDHYCRDCKDGKDGMRIIEATSTSIVIYDVLNPMVKPEHFKVWSPLQHIENNDEDDEDEIKIVLLHRNLNIIFWASKDGIVGAYDFQNENLIGRVHLLQFRETSYLNYILELTFSINLNMLVCCCDFAKEDNLFTWTLNSEQAERINGFAGHNICDLHNDEVQLLVAMKDSSLGICDLQQRKELHRWHTKDINVKSIYYAKYSCDSQLVYAIFDDYSIGVFDATCLQLHCRITPSAYSSNVNPPDIWGIVVHPQKRNQFSMLSWSNKVVYIIEPSHDLGGEWVCKAYERVGGKIQGL